MAVLAVVIVLAGAVLIIPGMVDWNAYKAGIAARIGAATGRMVELNGDLHFTLLPTPALSVEDARLANPPGFGGPDMARLGRLQVEVALMPLLSGRVQVRDIHLFQPVFVFEVLVDGRTNWDFVVDSAGRERPPVGLGGGLAGALSFDEIGVHGGTFLYRDARSGREERLEEMHARVVAASVAGPFQVQSDFFWRGVPLHGEVTTGRFSAASAVPVRAAFALPNSDTTVRFAGIVPPPGERDGRAQGDLRLEGSHLSDLLQLTRSQTERGALPVPLADAFSLRAAVEAASGGLDLNGVDLQIGETRATGTVKLRGGAVPDIQAQLSVGRLDLDAWLGAAGAADGAPGPDGGEGHRAVAAKPFALPEGLTATLDLGVDTLLHNGGIVRQTRFEGRLEQGAVSIERLAALLPGGADLAAAGTLRAADGRPSADLRFEANADDLRGLLQWLKLDPAGVPPDRLRRATLAARLQGTPDNFTVTGVDLGVDGSRGTGGLAYVKRDRPALGVQLDIDRLNLDAYLPATVWPGAEGPSALAAAAAAPGRLPRLDVHLQLSAASLTRAGTAIQGARLDLVSSATSVVVRDLQIEDVAGLKVAASGQASSLAPLRNGHLTLDLRAASLAGVARLAGWPEKAPSPERLGAAALQGRIAGDLDRVAAELTLVAAGGTVAVGGSVSAPTGDPQVDLKVRATHDDLGRLLHTLLGDGGGPDDIPPSLGALDLYGEVSGTRSALSVAGLQGTVAGTAVRGTVSGALAGDRPRFDAVLQTGELDVDRLRTGSADGLPAGRAVRPEPLAASAGQGGIAGWFGRFDGRLALTMAGIRAAGLRLENPALTLTLADRVLTVEQLDGGLLDGQVGATGRLALPIGAPASGELSVTVVKARPGSMLGSAAGFGLTGGTVDLDLDLSGRGATVRALLDSLEGSGRLAARDGVAHGFDMAALAAQLGRIDRPQEALPALARGLEKGDTPYSRIDGAFRVAGGVVRSDELVLEGPAGSAAGGGLVRLADGSLDVRLRIAAQADRPVPPLSLRLTGSLEAPVRAFDMREVQDFFAARSAPVPATAGDAAGGAGAEAGRP